VGFTISTPPRIVLDLPEHCNRLGKADQDFSEGDLRSANIVQAGNRTRLVVNLNQMLSYDTKLDGNSVTVTLYDKPKGGDLKATTRFAEEGMAGQLHEILGIDFRRSKDGDGVFRLIFQMPGLGLICGSRAIAW